MAVTRTQNLGLGLQLDKTDYLDWDEITNNWQKIDEAYNSGGSNPDIAVMLPNEVPFDGTPEIIDEPTPVN